MMWKIIWRYQPRTLLIVSIIHRGQTSLMTQKSNVFYPRPPTLPPGVSNNSAINNLLTSQTE